MTDKATKILESFDQLAPEEQHSVVVSLLKRTGELPSIALTDDELCGIADELFSSLDDSEDGNRDAQSR